MKHRYRVTLDLNSPSFQRSASRPSVVVETLKRGKTSVSGCFRGDWRAGPLLTTSYPVGALFREATTPTPVMGSMDISDRASDSSRTSGMLAEFWSNGTRSRRTLSFSKVLNPTTPKIQDAGQAPAMEGQRHPLGKSWVSWLSAPPSLSRAVISQPPADGLAME